MNLRISNPRARELAFQLAAGRKVSMTRAVIDALENELVREQEQASLADA
ncbi:type II toxin-antitoxin system VapB family antitoxin [Mesorhizobium salmacidum]|uniref:Type II toxin-antitoxin system VapB family antitoxin n=1 Tax=Mesorhizobium salmacidum TaxID=3015171 RepID=A0ABU8L0L4_9HYPH